MKRFYIIFCLSFILPSLLFAQSKYKYKSAVGLGIDFGSNVTLVGPSYKYLINKTSAIQTELVFGSGITSIGGYYQFHGPLKNTKVIKWYGGFGPSFLLFKEGSNVLLRPMFGIDTKLPDVPISINLDWRPAFNLNNNNKATNTFEPGRLGLAIRYTLN